MDGVAPCGADGDLDLVFVVDSEPNQILLNDGSATFTHAAPNAFNGATAYADGVALADVDNDMDLDIVVYRWVASIRIPLPASCSTSP